eukprot:tig00021070_g17805.t1
MAGNPSTTVSAAPAIPAAVAEARTRTPFSAHAHEASTATVTGLAWVCGADELRRLSALEDATSVAQLAGLCGLLREAAAAPAGPDAPRLALELPVVQRQFGGDVSKALEAAREACRAALELFAEKAIPSPAELADACAVVLSGDAELSRSLLDVLLSLRRSTVLARVPPARVGALAGVLGRLPRGTLTSTDRARLLRGVGAASPGDVDALASLRLVPAALAAVEARGSGAGFDSDGAGAELRGAAKELDALLRGFEGCGWWRAEAAASFARQALAAASSDYDPLQNALGRAKALGRVVYKLYRAGKVVFDGVSSFGVTTAMELVAAAKEAAGSVDGAGVLEDVREFWADLRQLVGADDLQGKKCWYRRARLVAALAEGGHLAELEAELPASPLTRGPGAATTDAARRNVVDLAGHVDAFLRRRLPARGGAGSADTAPAAPAGGARVLLIAGEPGSSKSTFLAHLHRRACEQWAGADGRPPAGDDDRLPVTCLLRLSNITRERAASGLRAEAAGVLGLPEADLPTLRDSRGLVLLLDAYDELETGVGRPPALWNGNELGKWASAVVVTCRSAYLAAQPDYPALFAPGGDRGALEEVCTHPFDSEQVGVYVSKYVGMYGPTALEGSRDLDCTWTAEEYAARIAQVPGTATLIENPFTLTMVVKSLPKILKSREAAHSENAPAKAAASYLLTIRELYQQFVELWFKRQWDKSTLAAKETGDLKDWTLSDFQEYSRGYCKDLADAMFRAAVSEVLCPPKKAKGAQYVPRSAKAADATSMAAVPAEGAQGADLRLCIELLTYTSDPVLAFCRDNCPLRVARAADGGTAVRFLHKTLLEYFVAEGAYADGANAFRSAIEGEVGAAPHEERARPHAKLQALRRAQSIADGSAAVMRADPSLLHLRLLTKEPKILQFLADCCTADVDYRDKLLELMERSRREDATPGDITASANAMTILNRAGYSFAGSSLRRVRVPGADLQRLEAAGADLRGADLTGCSLLDANLAGADLRGAVLMDCSVTLNPALRGHEDYVNAVAITRDGKRAVSGSGDSTLRVWDLESGVELRRLAGHEDGVSSVAILPDGKRAVSGGSDKRLRVWDLESGAELRCLAGHEGSVSSVAILPDGKRAVSGSSDKTLRVWDLESGAELRRLAGHEGRVTSVAISPDGKRAVSGSGDSTLRMWDLESGAELRCLEGHEDRVISVAISPDGKRALSGSWDKTLRMWDLESGEELRCLAGHERDVGAVAISPDGKRAVSGSGDSTLRVWDLESGAELRRLAGHERDVGAVAISPDGKRAVSGSEDTTLRVWDLESGEELRCLAGHERDVGAVAISPDGKRAVSGSEDTTLRVWDLESGAELRRLAGHEGGVTSVAISPDGKRAVSGGEDKTLRVWDLESGAELRCLEGHEDRVISVAISPDGKRAVSGGEDTTLRVWDLESGAELRCLEGHEDRVISVAFSPDGKRAVSGREANTLQLRLWDLESGAKLRRLTGHECPVNSVAISPDGKRAVSGSDDDTVRLWDLESGAELRCLAGHGHFAFSLAILPDGKRTVSGGHDRTLRLWDLESGAELRCLAGHEDAIRSVSISPDGKRAVSGSEDTTLRVWDLESGAELARTKFPPPKIYTQFEFKLAFSKDAAALRIRPRIGEEAAPAYVWRWQSAETVDREENLQFEESDGSESDGSNEVDKEHGLQSGKSDGSEWEPFRRIMNLPLLLNGFEFESPSFTVAEGALGGRGLIAVGRPDGTINVSTLPRVFCARRIGTKRAQEFRGCKYDGATVMSAKLALLLEQEGGVRLEAGEGGAGEGDGEAPEPAVRLWLPGGDE